MAREYNKTVGSGGTLAIRQYLNLLEYSSRASISKQQKARQALESTPNDVVNAEEQISLQDFSNVTDLQSLTNTEGELHGAGKSLETSMTYLGFELSDVANKRTQTEGLASPELQGPDKALRSIRGELTNKTLYS